MSNRFRSFGRFLLTLLLALSFFLSACGGVAPEPAPDVEIEQHPVSTEERAEGEIEPILAEITNVLDPPHRRAAARV